MAIITSTFPQGERGKALGLMMPTMVIGAIAGPALGGLLVGAFGWRAAFWFNLPLGLLGVIASVAILDKTRSGDPAPGTISRQFDWLGATLSAVALLMAITNGHKWGWGSPQIIAPMLGFIALLAGFICWELRIAEPLLDLRMFKRRIFSLGISASFLTFLGSSAILFLTPFYLQRVLGYSPTQAGLIAVPAALCIAVVAPVSGRLSDRYGWRRFTVGGMAIAIAGLLMLSTLDERSSLPMVIAALVVHGIGMGTFFSPNTSSILSVVERERFGVVAAFTTLVRNGANVISLAMATVIVTATMASMGFQPSLDAVQCGFEGDACQAFADGLTRAYRAMAVLLIVSMCISAVSGGRTTGVPAEAGAAAEAFQPGN